MESVYRYLIDNQLLIYDLVIDCQLLIRPNCIIISTKQHKLHAESPVKCCKCCCFVIVSIILKLELLLKPKSINIKEKLRKKEI